MKKVIGMMLAILMIASTAMVLGGCGKKKSSSSSDDSDSSRSTVAATQKSTSPTTNVTKSPATLPSMDQGTLPQDSTTPDATQNQDGTESEYTSIYGGLSGQEAILKAMSYAGAGYQCVYYDREYLNNNEAWYIGLQAADGNDDTVYYLYVNADRCVPVSEIPNIGGDNGDGSGVFAENYAGISEQEAIFKAIEMYDNYQCISSQQTTLGGEEYWLISIIPTDDPDAEITNVYVNSGACFEM